MPYIKQVDRVRIDLAISNANTVEELFDNLSNRGERPISAGELNYLFSHIVWAIFDEKPSYTKGNELVGVLECVKQEFIRRRLNDYEDEKIKENGDL